MADVIASTLLEAVFKKLADVAVKKVGRVQGIRSELKSLGKTLSRIQALLVDASDKEIKNELVQNWLNDLKHLAYDIDDILDDLATDAMHREFVKNSGASTSKVRKLISSCCTNLSLCTKTYHKLDNINLRLQDLENEKTTIGLTVKNGGLEVRNNRSKDKNRVLETSLVDASSIVGRQGEKDELIDKLLGNDPHNKNFSIVPIFGMGGVGKTTLAKILYNDKQVNSYFELKAWVCVSDEWDSFQISKSIFQSVGGEWDEKFKIFNLLQEALVNKLREKKFLLVLDDIWTESYKDWETLVRPLSACARGSKVIITTRKDQLLKKLDCGQLKQLQCLSHDDAVSLFCQNALDANNFDLYPTLTPHGEDIVGKCKGLPLALIALGRLLRRKDDEGWKEMVDSEIWSLKEGVGIIPALKLSYHELPASLKQLFAYCSLFPKDDLFKKDDLVLLWMAEGFLHQSDPSISTEERLGHDYFEELLSRSFFQHAPDDESLFVMHDLMHDLATSVAEEFFFRLEKDMGKDVRKLALEKLRHMSFVREEYEAYKKFMVFIEANCLRTFLSVGVKDRWQTNHLPNKMLVDLLPRLPLLRVINLSYYEISEVPECIGSLKHLRYINLSRTNITRLPETVCDLYNLQTLIIFGCDSLAKLPNNFSKLKNLRHLDIRDTPELKDMPLGMDELKSLQTLSKIIIGGENDFSITQLRELKNLRGSVSIKGLNKVKEATEAREANLSQKKLNELKLEWSDDESDGSGQETDIKEVLDALKPCDGDLKKLEIVNYCGLVFPNWVGDASFLRLARVSIRGCKNCTSLPPFGQLPSLKKLSIYDMDNVKVVGSEFLGNGVSFPSLEFLSFGGMPGWEVWSTNGRSTTGVVRDAVFPCLKLLYIGDCPSLVEFSLKGDNVFPFLQKLRIRSCSNLLEVSVEELPSLRVLRMQRCGDGVLRSVVRVAPTVTEVEILSISGLTNEVWRGVILDLKAVEALRVEKCDEIRYLWESKEAEASSKVLVNLRKLYVRDCTNMVSLWEKDEEEYNYGSNILTSLSSLAVYSCKKFKRLSCPSNIETLEIRYCKSITCVSYFSKGGGQKLKSITIWGCKKLLLYKEELGEGGEKNTGLLINSKTMPMLEYLEIRYHPNVVEFGGKFIHLTTLVIYNCESTTESLFADLQLQTLTLLTELLIIYCPSMDVPTDGLWPPNLCRLVIGELKKPISEWGPQKFPSTLVDLSLYGKTEAATNWSQLSHLHLSSSLTRLWIDSFEKLETVSEGLQHLTSLQHLQIGRCPKMKDLPETLLPSLLSLLIVECPILEERCSRGGSYWPQISLIPSILIWKKDIAKLYCHHVLACLRRPQGKGLDLARKHIASCLVELQSILKTEDFLKSNRGFGTCEDVAEDSTTASGCQPIGFDSTLNSRLSAPTLPRAMKLLSWKKTHRLKVPCGFL
uniref:NBS-LRR resistance-like protein n=1 Tax=Tanacetum cinerariifolium TaxID=118510 RepID=A0A6L2N2T6_TANCI|nr:NBS-LRR resistance-like protein [Tanacetum cinerariifolium]